MTLTPREHQALRDLAPTREVYGKPPLPIEILAAGGPRALERYEKTLGTEGPRSRTVHWDVYGQMQDGPAYPNSFRQEMIA